MGILSRKKSEFKRINTADVPVPEEIVDEFDDTIEEVEEEKPKERFIVVKELPEKQIRTTKAKDGMILNFITVEEALTEFMNQ